MRYKKVFINVQRTKNTKGLIKIRVYKINKKGQGIRLKV